MPQLVALLKLINVSATHKASSVHSAMYVVVTLLWKMWLYKFHERWPCGKYRRSCNDDIFIHKLYLGEHIKGRMLSIHVLCFSFIFAITVVAWVLQIHTSICVSNCRKSRWFFWNSFEKHKQDRRYNYHGLWKDKVNLKLPARENRHTIYKCVQISCKLKKNERV